MASWLGSLPILTWFEPILTTFGFTALATLSFGLLYKLVPEVKIAWRDVWLGAVVAAFLVTIGGWVIIFFVQNTSFASALEAAGSFVVLITGFYYFAQIFLFGVILTRTYSLHYGFGRQIPA